MFRLVISKIKNKKWLNICLLTGIVLLVSVFTCHPMLEKGAGNKILWDGFEKIVEDTQEYPAVFSREGSYNSKDFKNTEAILAKLARYEEKWQSYVDINVIDSIKVLRLAGDSAELEYADGDIQMIPTYMSDMEQNIRIKRKMPGSVQDGVFPVMVSEQMMDTYGLVVGEMITFKNYFDGSDEPAKFQIEAVFEPDYSKGNYWYHAEDLYKNAFYVSTDTLNKLVSDYGFVSIQFADYQLLDYTQINADNADLYYNYITQFKKADSLFSCSFYDLLTEYETGKKTVSRVLFVLELPCVVILILFLYMVAQKLAESEEGEIAVMRSRGVKKIEIILMYIMQNGMICVLAVVLGLILGAGLGKIAASTDGFLQFAIKDTSDYSFTAEMLFYAVIASVIAIIVTMIPVVLRAAITIVTQKSNKNIRVVPLWEKSFIDVILFVLSGYLMFDYSRQKESLAMSVIQGKGIDPLVILNASIFIMASALLFLRLFRYGIKLVNYIGRDKWGAAIYSTFIQIIRTYSKQCFIAVFLIMTIAGGIFAAGMARTVNQNLEKRITYEIGCDAILTEKWIIHHTITRGADEKNIAYYEATDVEQYKGLIEDGSCDSYTRVVTDKNTQISYGSKRIDASQLMAINTKEFGETATLEIETDPHWFNALNKLAVESGGAIISSTTAKKLGASVGDYISYCRPDVDEEKSISLKVVAIVDCFPGYNTYSYEEDKDGNISEVQKGLIVVNYAALVGDYGTQPYDIWMKTSNPKAIKTFLDKEKIDYDTFVIREETLEKNRGNSLVQVTNGMFTISFFITILVCFVGFILYWIMEMKQRQLQYGIYRSVGMKMKDIWRILITEQILSSAVPIIFSVVLGIATMFMFAPIILVMYIPEKSNVPSMLYMSGADIGRILVILLVMLLSCLFILVRQIKNMKITQALKLGED